MVCDCNLFKVCACLLQWPIRRVPSRPLACRLSYPLKRAHNRQCVTVPVLPVQPCLCLPCLPQYPLLLTKLADAGYTCIATPFAVTFNHVGCARDVHAAFLAAVAQLRAGRGTWAAPAGVPTHGVGHSNGALLHALIGVVCPPEDNGSSSSSSAGGGKPAAEAAAGAAGAPEAGPRASNVLMSFNNLQVSSWVWLGAGLALHATGWSEDVALHATALSRPDYSKGCTAPRVALIHAQPCDPSALPTAISHHPSLALSPLL